MPSRSLGSTGLRVSRLGLGLAALGRPAYINLGRLEDFGHQRSIADLQRRCHDMLNAAYAAGIRYIDAARSYGMAEAFLGTWLSGRSLPKDAITIGSKWGYTYVGGWQLDAPVHEMKDLSVATLRRQMRSGLAVIEAALHGCQAVMLSTILPRLCDAPPSISCAMRASSSGSTVPTFVTSLSLSNNSVILFSLAVVTST